MVAVFNVPLEYFTRTFRKWVDSSRYDDTEPLSRSASFGAVVGVPR